MPYDSIVLGLRDYQIKEMAGVGGEVRMWVRYTGPVRCPHCQGSRLRKKARFERQVRHESLGQRRCHLYLEAHKYRCTGCGRYFNQRFPGILPRRRSTEPFRRQIFWMHFDGICRKTLAERHRLGTATVERWFLDFLRLEAAKLQSEECPRLLGLDEHFFTRKRGYATTLCDLKHHKVYDVVLGRSEAALDVYFSRLRGKEKVRVVCIDLASNYRALIRKHFPQAKIVADRFHVIRLVGYYFHRLWRELDPAGSAHRGLVRLMRRRPERLGPEQAQRLAAYLQKHPGVGAVYAFRQQLWNLLSLRTLNPPACRRFIPQLLRALEQLKASGFDAMRTLADTLEDWKEEIVRMWRFSKSNGITEGFHTKMEMLSRRAFGFRNFENYRLRVRVMCA